MAQVSQSEKSDKIGGKTFPKFSKLALILISNLLPLLGVIFWQWDLANIILLYWAENLVIGFWTLAKMCTSKAKDKNNNLFGKLSECAFFTFHYGGFCLAHAAIILQILGAGDAKDFFPFRTMIDHGLLNTGLIIGAFIMLFTYGIDFVQYYLPSKMRQTLTASVIMFIPYGHIIIIHLALFASAAFISTTGQPMGLLIAIIFGKICLELIALKFYDRIFN